MLLGVLGRVDKTSGPEGDACDVDDSQEAGSGRVVAGCDAAAVLELSKAAPGQVAQGVEGPIHALTGLSVAAHRYDWDRVAGFRPGADAVGIVALICQQRGGRGQVVAHDEVEALVVRGLARRHVGPHRQAPSVRSEVGLGRLATS